ncbi:MAG: hypothetical protein ACRYFS_18240 [Janthinobacterium lividum]
MEQQQTGGGSGTGEPSLTEEVQAQPESEGTNGTETPALNRADRRAQAKGKKAGANPNLTGGGAHGPSGRTSGHAGPVRFPRTGHK